MTWWLITWLSFSCPFGLLNRFVPDRAKVFLCTPSTQTTICTKRKRAIQHIRESGCKPGFEIKWCKNLKCWKKKVECIQVVKLEGEVI